MSLKLKFPDSGYKTFLLSYPMVFLIATLEFVYFLVISAGPQYFIDSFSYIEATANVLQGVPDIFRTPVYPLIIGICRGIFGAGGDYAVVILQFLVFLTSGYFLYKIGRQYIGKPRPVFWMTAFYLIYPSLVEYTVGLLTESLSMSCMIFLTYTLVRFLSSPRGIMSALWPSIWLMILLYLRPAFLFLLPILAVIFIVFCIKKKLGLRLAVVSFGGLLLTGASIFAYTKVITNLYGIHSTSCVTLINNYFTIRYGGIVDPNLAETPKLREFIEGTVPNRWNHYYETVQSELNHIVETNTWEDLEKYENNLIKAYPKDFIKTVFMRWDSYARLFPILPNVVSDFPCKADLIYDFIPNMGAYCLFLLIMSIYSIISWRREREIPIISLMLILICAGLFITTIAGAQDDYARLNAPALPLFFLLIAKFASVIKVNVKAFK